MIGKLFGGGLGWATRKAIFKQIASQVDNGLSLDESLQDYQARLERRKKKAMVARIQAIRSEIANGKTFVQAIDSDLTTMERSILTSGESVGKLSESIRLLLDVRERLDRIVGKVRSAAVSPAVYFIALYATLYIIGAQVVPQFADALPVEKWRGSAKIMYYMGQAAVSPWGLVAIGAFLAVIAAAIFSLPRWTGPSRVWFDRSMPPYNVYRDIEGFAWLMTFTALVKSGVSDVDAIGGQIKTGTKWLASRLKPIHLSMRNGIDIATAMRSANTSFPSDELIDEIGAYSRFPDFVDKISAITVEYADTLDKRVSSLSSMVTMMFTMIMFGAFIVIQLGSNEISGMLTSGAR